MKRFMDWSNSELANYYTDLSAYNDEKASNERKELQKEIVRRFIDEFSDIQES